MLQDLLRDQLVLIPATGTPDGQGGFTQQSVQTGTEQRVMGRIEPRTGAGRRLVADQGDVPISQYTAYVLPWLYDETGNRTSPMQAAVDWRIRAPDGFTYIVVADPSPAKDRFNNVHHVELLLERIGGGV